MKGILLAAGVGKRLKPLTDHTPKPLLKIGGKPILEWVLLGLKKSGIVDIGIITGHLEDQLHQYFRDGASLGLSLSYFHQDVPDGTARAVLPAAEFLGNEPFFLGYGDIIVHPVNYEKLVGAFHDLSSQSYITGWEVEDPSAAGALVVRNGMLIDLVEKPPAGSAPSNLINAGLMIFQPDILEHIRAVKRSSRGEYELTDAIISLAKSSPVRVLNLEKFWSDIGSLDKLLEADAWISSIG